MNQTLDELQMVHEEEMKNFDRIQACVMDVMHRHGCKVIQTPTFEDYDTYGKYFPALQKEMVKTIDSDGSVIVLRPDVTLPLVKTVAKEYPDPAQLLKFGYVSMVFREYYGKSTHGKYFLQSGIEVLGDPSPECDGEVVASAAEFLESLGIRDMRIDLGTVAYMDALFAELRLTEEELREIREQIEKRNLVAFRALADRLSITKLQREVLLALPELFGDYEETLERAEALAMNAGMAAALKRLRAVYEYLEAAGYADRAALDLGFTSHMGYYTDLVFKIYADGALYSLISGGRYDKLSSQFHVDRPACGFGMNMNLLYEFLADAGLLEELRPSVELAVRYDRAEPALIAELTRWRKKGFSVMGADRRSRISPADYLLVAEYKDGKYEIGGETLTAEEVEKKLEKIRNSESGIRN